MSKPVVLVTGATGNVGTATVKHLQNKGVTVRVCVREEKKSAEKFKGHTVETVVADGEKDLSAAFKGVDVVLIIPPAHKRVEVANAYTQAAKAAGVKFIVAISVTLAYESNLIFGKQFGAIEKTIVETKIPYSMIRANFFLENYFGNIGGIKANGQFYAPTEGDNKYTPISADDIGAMAAVVMTNAHKYTNTILYASGDQVVTSNTLADTYSRILKKEVKFVQVPNAGCKQALVGMGMPDWQVDGIIELWERINSKDCKMNVTGDACTVLGRNTITAEQFLATIAHMHN